MPMQQRFISPPLSPLDGVSNDGWRALLTALEVQAPGDVSDSGGLGSYDIRPRRLVELGYASGLRSVRTETERQIQVCDFILPWTQARFLADALAQHAVVVKSMRLYYDALVKGELKRPVDVSFSGALAILHIAGTGGFKAWPNLFEHTRALYEKTRGAF